MLDKKLRVQYGKDKSAKRVHAIAGTSISPPRRKRRRVMALSEVEIRLKARSWK